MSRIKECIVSRWGDDGYIVEADFSQLEVIGLAYLSNDKQLKGDILAGVDMHCMNAAFLYNTPYDDIKAAVAAGDPVWIKKRKIAKAPGFLIQYGGGAGAMAKQTGLSMEACKGFIENYYKRYSRVKEWQDEVAAEVQKSRRPSSKKTVSGMPAMVGTYESITGRVYKFVEYDAPKHMQKRGTLTSFSPTQMKNYPVQGFATADIVPAVVGRIHTAIKRCGDKEAIDGIKLINTVHDSIILDVKAQYIDRICTWVREIMEDTPGFLQQAYNISFDMPLKVDVEYGHNWKELKTYEGK